LRIEVHDDGPGFAQLGMPDGHGLALLRARLNRIFGEDAAVTVENANGGAIVRMDLPTRGPARTE
jgi:LytS/YehU family sensor histidine kinase